MTHGSVILINQSIELGCIYDKYIYDKFANVFCGIIVKLQKPCAVVFLQINFKRFFTAGILHDFLRHMLLGVDRLQ